METTLPAVSIPTSKKKMAKALAGAAVLFAGSAWILVFQPTVSNAVFNSPLIKYGAAGLGALLFGFLFIGLTVKLFSGRSGMVIDGKGIADNSALIDHGLIPWSDIVSIETLKVAKQDFVVLMVKDPEAYIEKQSGYKKMILKANYKNYRSPLYFTDKSLQIKLPELRALFEERLQAYKTAALQ